MHVWRGAQRSVHSTTSVQQSTYDRTDDMIQLCCAVIDGADLDTCMLDGQQGSATSIEGYNEEGKDISQRERVLRKSDERLQQAMCVASIVVGFVLVL